MKPGDLVAGRFAIERLASSGGMGAVYRAIDRLTGEPVAVKALLDGGRGLDAGGARFEREAEVLATLSHPAVVRYVAHGRAGDGEAWLAIEWLDGVDLGARLLLGPKLGLGESVDLARRVAEALGAAHARAVLHRDVKPSNIFLPGGAAARVKVLDFGIARLAGVMSGATRTGTAIGTPGYMAPEQARGARDLDARADVFALGCVLFECLAGRPVFAGEHVMAILAKVLLEDAPRLREIRFDVPAALDALVARMLSKAREDRPIDGDAVAAALASIPAEALSGDTGPASEIALGSGEKRLLCVVLAGSPDPPEVPGPPTLLDARSALDDTMSREDATAAPASRVEAIEAQAAVHRDLGRFGARVESLVDGSMVATLAGAGSATDQAAQAARFALAMRARLPDLPMALATGRGWAATERFPVGEVIDRAAASIRADLDDPGAPASRPIRLDETTAGLLDARFDVGGDARGLVLAGEREAPEASRTLLGRETACVGRERELSVLIGLFDECVSEPVPRAVLITAGAGAGKSRLRYELLKKLRADGRPFEVWMGRGDPMSRGQPFGLVAPAIRRAAGIHDGEPLAVRRQKLCARAGRYLAGDARQRAAEFLGELVGTPFADEESVELHAARRDAMLMGDQMRAAFEAFLAVECEARPIVLVLENLQWGDLPSIAFVDAALRSLEALPLLVVALGRPEVRELFPKMWEERAVHELRLPDLTKKSSERLARQVLGADAPAATVDRIVAQAAGNAFFLEELVRAVVEGKGEKLPETVLAMAEARLERLDPRARRALRAGSVFGQVFWRDGVAALLGGQGERGTAERADGTLDRGPSDHDATLASLVDLEILARRSEARFPDQIEYIFRHAIAREAAYAMLTDADLALGHRLAAAWLERAGEVEAVVLAEHWERGGEPLRAASFFARAAAQALEGNDLAAVIERAQRGAAAGTEGRALGELRLLEAEAQRWRGDNAAAARASREASELLTEGSPAWYAALGELCAALGKIGDLDALVALVERIIARPPDCAGPDDLAVLYRAVVQLIYVGKYPLAGALLERVGGSRSFSRQGDHDRRSPRATAQLHQARATWATCAGDVAAYLRETELCREYAEIAGDRRLVSLQGVNLGDAYLQLGGYAEAERVLRETVAGASRMGLGFVSTIATVNLGCALGYQGRRDEARRALLDVLASPVAKSDVRIQIGSQIYLSFAHFAAGDLEAAALAAREAVAIPTQLAPIRAVALGALARALVALGRRDEALDAAREATAALEALGRIETSEAVVRLAWAEALHAAGDEPRAREAIAIARRRLLARADPIGDPAWRKSFLERVPENAATLALASEWIGEEPPAA